MKFKISDWLMLTNFFGTAGVSYYLMIRESMPLLIYPFMIICFLAVIYFELRELNDWK